MNATTSLGLVMAGAILAAGACEKAKQSDLWDVYNRSFKSAKYIDLTHTITPSIPVWKGFGPSKFAPTVNPETGKAYRYATRVNLP